MKNKEFKKRLKLLQDEYQKLITRKNKKIKPGNGIFYRYKYPVITAAHTPEDGYRTGASVETRIRLINNNLEYLNS